MPLVFILSLTAVPFNTRFAAASPTIWCDKSPGS